MTVNKFSFRHSRSKNSRRGKPRSQDSGKPLSLNDSQDEGWLDIVDDGPETSTAKRPATRPRKAKRSTVRRPEKSALERIKEHRRGKAFLARPRSDAEAGLPTNLHECHSVADIDSLRAYQAKAFQEKALHPLKPKTKKEALGDRYNACMRAIFGDGTNHPTMAGHRALTDAHEHTGRGLIAMVNANPSLQVVFVTIVSGDGVTSSNMPVIDVEREISKAKKFASKVTPNFLGTVELSLFSSHKHDLGGRVIQTHSHILMAGENILEKAEAAARAFGGTLPANFTDAPQILVKPVATDDLNLMKMASYLFKLPHKAKTWCPPREGKRGHMQHGGKGRSINFLRMAMILTMMPFEKLVFAGGTCKSIRTGLIRDVRSNCASACVNPDRMLAPDTIGALWVEVAKAFNRPEWHLPVIITSK